ncbi:hypothetical protein D3C75_675340 [compost metagenome]
MCEVDRRWHHAFGWGRITGKRHFHQRLAVNRIVNGFTHFRVIKRLLRHVHAEITLHDGRRSYQLQLVVFLQHASLLVRDGEGKLRFAGLEHGRSGVVINHRTPGDGVELRQPLFPVTVEFLHLHKISLVPGIKLIRASADRMETNLFAVFFQRGRGNHRRCRVGENINKRRERLFKGDFYRAGVNRFGFGNGFIQVVALEMVFRIAGAIEVNLHRFGVEISPILEFNARV